jgi:hypothetical protein
MRSAVIAFEACPVGALLALQAEEAAHERLAPHMLQSEVFDVRLEEAVAAVEAGIAYIQAHHITGFQVLVARNALGWTRRELSQRARYNYLHLGVEKSDAPLPGRLTKVRAVRATLEAAGIRFLPDGTVVQSF